MTKRKKRSLKKTTVVDFATYLGVTILFVVMYSLQSSGSLTRSLSGLLIPSAATCPWRCPRTSPWVSWAS